jgi:hypothetical protein
MPDRVNKNITFFGFMLVGIRVTDDVRGESGGPPEFDAFRGCHCPLRVARSSAASASFLHTKAPFFVAPYHRCPLVIDAARQVEPHHDIGGAMLLGLLSSFQVSGCAVSNQSV